MRALINELGVEETRLSTFDVFDMLCNAPAPKGAAMACDFLEKLLEHPHFIFRDTRRITAYALQLQLLPGLLDQTPIMLDYVDSYLVYMEKNDPHSRGVVTLITYETGDQKGYCIHVSTVKGVLFDNLTRKYFINTFIDSI